MDCKRLLKCKQELAKWQFFCGESMISSFLFAYLNLYDIILYPNYFEFVCLLYLCDILVFSSSVMLSYAN